MRIHILWHRDISGVRNMPWLTDIPLLVNWRTRPPSLILGNHRILPIKSKGQCMFFCISDRHKPENANVIVAFLCRHIRRHGFANHQPHDCLLNQWPVTRKMFPFDDVIMVHDGVMMWTHFPYYCTCVKRFHWLPVDCPDKVLVVWNFVSIVFGGVCLMRLLNKKAIVQRFLNTHMTLYWFVLVMGGLEARITTGDFWGKYNKQWFVNGRVWVTHG